MDHHVFASSFADPDDVAAYHKWFAIFKARGFTDEAAQLHAFAHGDNGIGCWDDDCTGPEPACALPPEKMIERWGGLRAARHKRVHVAANDREVVCVLKDRMPPEAHITNGAGIDLTPAAVAALGLRPPVKVHAVWQWADDLPA